MEADGSLAAAVTTAGAGITLPPFSSSSTATTSSSFFASAPCADGDARGKAGGGGGRFNVGAGPGVDVGKCGAAGASVPKAGGGISWVEKQRLLEQDLFQQDQLLEQDRIAP